MFQYFRKGINVNKNGQTVYEEYIQRVRNLFKMSKIPLIRRAKFVNVIPYNLLKCHGVVNLSLFTGQIC